MVLTSSLRFRIVFNRPLTSTDITNPSILFFTRTRYRQSVLKNCHIYPLISLEFLQTIDVELVVQKKKQDTLKKQTMEVLSRCYGNAPAIPIPDVIRLSLKGDVDGLTQCLSQTGSSPDTVDAERHRTGLHHAAARGHDAVMAALLSAGADPNFRDVHGNTPLHLCGHGMTLSLLMHYGADPRLRNATGVTAVEMMRRRGVAEDIVATLAEYEKGFDEQIFLAGEEEEEETTEMRIESIALRQRRTLNVPVYDAIER